MADPTRYVPGYSFTDFQTSDPSAPLPAPHVDDELFKVGIALGTTIDAVESIRRSDGKLQNGIVTADSLDAGIEATLTGFSAASAAAAAASASTAAAEAVIATSAATSSSASAGAASTSAGVASSAAGSLTAAVNVINALGYLNDWGLVTDAVATTNNYGTVP